MGELGIRASRKLRYVSRDKGKEMKECVQSPTDASKCDQGRFASGIDLHPTGVDLHDVLSAASRFRE